MARKRAAEGEGEAPAQWHEELSDALLLDGAGATVFGRGLAYFREGRCALERAGGTSTTWRVRGTGSYQVDLGLEQGGLHAACTCPYAADGGFCKHMVAAALAWRQHLGSVPGEAVPMQAQSEALQTFLHSRAAAELAERLWHWALRDRDMLADLKAWQTLSEAPNRPQGWKQALTDILRKTRDYYDWRESNRYAERAGQVLPLLRDLVDADPQAGRDACVAALRRMFKVCEHADDSGGAIGAVMLEIHAVMLAALAAAPPEGKTATQWVKTWVALQDDDPWGLWGDAEMVEAAGEAVAERFSERVAADWAGWLAQRRASEPGDRAASAWLGGSYDSVRERLRSRYLGDLRRRGDSAELIRVMSSDIRSGHECVTLAAALEQAGRLREAVAQLETGLKRFESDAGVEAALLEAYERDGCAEDAFAIRHRRLERYPDPAHYTAALAAAKLAGHDVTAYRTQLHEWAQQGEVRRGRGGHWGLVSLAPSPDRNVSVRAAWLLAEGRDGEALGLVRAAGAAATEGVWLALAATLAKTDPDGADAMYQVALQARMGRAQSPYRDELALVRDWIAALPAAMGRQRMVWLQAEFRAKRNFVAGLKAMDSA